MPREWSPELESSPARSADAVPECQPLPPDIPEISLIMPSVERGGRDPSNLGYMIVWILDAYDVQNPHNHDRHLALWPKRPELPGISTQGQMPDGS
jgi:hypothetical protein